MLCRLIVTGCVAVLLLSMVLVIVRLRLRGHNALSGKPPLPMVILITGKLSMTISVFTMLAVAIKGDPQTLPGFQWMAIFLLLAGAAIAILSMFHLGEELRFGLSQQQNVALKSKGLYHISRNPLYLGFYLIAIASCLYVPHWANIGFTALAVFIHHQIVLAEERFLHQQFGDHYQHYTKQVRRYL